MHKSHACTSACSRRAEHQSKFAHACTHARTHARTHTHTHMGAQMRLHATMPGVHGSSIHLIHPPNYPSVISSIHPTIHLCPSPTHSQQSSSPRLSILTASTTRTLNPKNPHRRRYSRGVGGDWDSKHNVDACHRAELSLDLDVQLTVQDCVCQVSGISHVIFSCRHIQALGVERAKQMIETCC